MAGKQSLHRYYMGHREAIRANRLQQELGITQEDYDALLNAQGGTCAICHVPENKGHLAVDHDHSCCSGRHSCGKCIRGLLCSKCNKGIGLLNDDPELLGAAVTYLAGA
jgi:hypothetical protein